MAEPARIDMSEDDVADTSATRRCLATGETLPREAMLRFVLAPDPALGVVPDIAGRLPGRGLWITAKRHVVAEAIARGAFARAARRPVKIDADLPERVERILVQRLVGWLGMARRAGVAVAGAEKLRAVAAKRPILGVIVASDAAADTLRKLGAIDAPRIIGPARAELALAFDHENIAQIGILDASWAERLTSECRRLAAFRASR
jgi:predicted RNA-binding protein YlxR (DUF448 family)